LLRREGLYSADVDAWRGGPEPPPADAPAPPPAPPPGPPPARKTRRRSPEQKLSILKQWEAADASGRAALKLREKVGVSHITAWRRARDAAALEALADRRLGPRRADADKLRIAELESANRRLADELDTARQVVKTQGKLVALLEQLPPNCATPPTGSGPVRR
jgi:hypothetical protein